MLRSKEPAVFHLPYLEVYRRFKKDGNEDGGWDGG